jgi:hypothetical protein
MANAPAFQPTGSEGPLTAEESPQRWGESKPQEGPHELR